MIWDTTIFAHTVPREPNKQFTTFAHVAEQTTDNVIGMKVGIMRFVCVSLRRRKKFGLRFGFSPVRFQPAIPTGEISLYAARGTAAESQVGHCCNPVKSMLLPVDGI